MKHSGTQKIETLRLLLRPFVINDCGDAFKNWASNPKIQTEYGEPIYTNMQEVAKLLKNWVDSYNNENFYRWAIIEKATNQNIGQIAFCKVFSDCYTAEIEYCIGESFWGNGYAGEALSAVIDFSFNNTDFLKLEAFHRIENEKSGRVLEKSNMRLTDNVERFKRENNLPHGEMCYAITRKDHPTK